MSSKDECIPLSKSALEERVGALRRHASIQRISVSRAAAELTNYCQEHVKNDQLVLGFHQRSNPYKETKGCPVM